MPKLKINQESIDRLIDRLSKIKARYKELSDFSTLKNRREWESAKSFLIGMSDMYEKAAKSVMENGQELEDKDRCKQIDSNLIRRDDFKFFVQVIENNEEEREKLQKNISDIEQEISDKRSELKEWE